MSRYTAIQASGPIADQKLAVLKEAIQARKASSPQKPAPQSPREARKGESKKR